MLRSRVHQAVSIDVGDSVAIWHDGSGWLHPARVALTSPYFYEVVHNGRVETSGLNRTRLLRSATHDDNDPRAAQGRSRTVQDELIYIRQPREYDSDHTVDHDETELDSVKIATSSVHRAHGSSGR